MYLDIHYEVDDEGHSEAEHAVNQLAAWAEAEGVFIEYGTRGPCVDLSLELTYKQARAVANFLDPSIHFQVEPTTEAELALARHLGWSAQLCGSLTTD